MNFFSSRAVAEEALKDYPNIAILTVEEAYLLARTQSLDPLEKVMEGAEDVN